MRGKAIQKVIEFPDNRITPAHAGKRMEDYIPMIYKRDHPRTCGEKSTQVSSIWLGMGSPPHMRGKGFIGGV